MRIAWVILVLTASLWGCNKETSARDSQKDKQETRQASHSEEATPKPSKEGVDAKAETAPAAGPTAEAASRKTEPRPQPKGRFHDIPFNPQKAMLVGVDSETENLMFYDVWEADRCREPYIGDVKYQFGAIAKKPLLFEEGKTLVKDDVSPYWGMADLAYPSEYEMSVVVDKIDLEQGVATGHIDFKAENTTFSGPFSADYCPTRQKDRATADPIAGMAWSMTPVEPTSIADTPAEAVLFGAPFAVAHANLRKSYGSRELNVFGAMPQNPCVGRPGGWSRDNGTEWKREGSEVDVFSILFRNEALQPTAGLAGSYLEGRDTPYAGGDYASQACLVEADGVRSGCYVQYQNMSFVLDEVDGAAKTFKARVYLAFDDSGKSFLVGAVKGVLCE
ncbi:MAG: hypothetical protein AUK47_00075 [Deltaproteobacteria bacterium CG2_30_63_29]|nr:MAG: hypothetical protein AUK47_00075 [Deltaproteobacteria bacterium CG2_30_63_29]PJB49065.1 MAG: hypothetical protein CO108_01065 [Deltaproteobacteria bacterium CG_4_9_14_3_um_filter_63_12]